MRIFEVLLWEVFQIIDVSKSFWRKFYLFTQFWHIILAQGKHIGFLHVSHISLVFLSFFTGQKAHFFRLELYWSATGVDSTYKEVPSLFAMGWRRWPRIYLLFILLFMYFLLRPLPKCFRYGNLHGNLLLVLWSLNSSLSASSWWLWSFQ